MTEETDLKSNPPIQHWFDTQDQLERWLKQTLFEGLPEHLLAGALERAVEHSHRYGCAVRAQLDPAIEALVDHDQDAKCAKYLEGEWAHAEDGRAEGSQGLAQMRAEIDEMGQPTPACDEVFDDEADPFEPETKAGSDV